MTNLHYIADEQLGGVEREYAEVERKANVGDKVLITEFDHEKVSEVRNVVALDDKYPDDFRIDKPIDDEDYFDSTIDIYATLDPTGNVLIFGTVYRMVDRKAAVGDIVLITDEMDDNEDNYDNGVVFTVADLLEGYDGLVSTEENISLYDEEYVVLESVENIEDLTQSADLSLTESDIRNNPRQVIDLIANLALRVTTLEKGAGRLSKLESRVERLGTANQQAYDIVSRNVETWAQEMAELKARMGDAGRALTAEERREL